ncbi:MAG: MarR family winged helix-turn-helix transcriptional regulator [Pirellulales bacterium]
MSAKKMNPSIDDVARECIAARMRMLNRVVTALYDDALRPLSLKVSQMNILVAVAKMGTARPAEICQRLHLDVSTLSRNVERMKARGWLEVVAGDDARAQPFRLTAEGRKVLEKAIPGWAKAQEKATELLGRGVAELLGGAIGRLGQGGVTK